MNRIALVISCEHAVDTVPQPYVSLFKPFEELLNSHRGIDFGALAIAEQIYKTVPCDFEHATTTRLLIDCNRSLNHAQCFSEVTRDLSDAEKQEIIAEYYLPYRTRVISLIKKYVTQGFQVWHLSIHSFTPSLNGIDRDGDVCFLYDPKRPAEKAIAKKWQLALKKIAPEYKTRMNYPYSGISDGFTSAMRKEFNDEQYVGIEVENNQALVTDIQILDKLKKNLSDSLLDLLY